MRSALLAAAVIVAIIVVATIGKAASRSNTTAGQGGQTSISVKVIPMYRSVTVSPPTAACSHYRGGSGADASTATALGYPNGRCTVGKPGSHASFPITVTYSGPLGEVMVKGSNAIPSAGGTPWRLCAPQGQPACKGRGGLPGKDQYELQTFAGAGQQLTGLTGQFQCDTQFNPAGYCVATRGHSQHEGVKLIGPAYSDNLSPSWTVTITWVAIPQR